MLSNRISKMIPEWNAEGKRRKGEPREMWVDGVRRSMISRRRFREQRIMKENNFFGMKDTYCIIEHFLIKKYVVSENILISHFLKFFSVIIQNFNR